MRESSVSVGQNDWGSTGKVGGLIYYEAVVGSNEFQPSRRAWEPCELIPSQRRRIAPRLESGVDTFIVRQAQSAYQQP